MRVIITGCRKITPDQAKQVRSVIRAFRDADISVGCAGGVDRTVRESRRNADVFYADWNEYGKKAGPLRNQKMVDYGADLCIAFPGPKSRGTYDCMARARAKGIPVVVYQFREPLEPEGNLDLG